MKRFAISILLIGAVIVGVGFYRGWFFVDQTRMEQDEKAAKREMNELGKEVKAKAEKLTGKDQD
jgi:hypothetical protein